VSACALVLNSIGILLESARLSLRTRYLIFANYVSPLGYTKLGFVGYNILREGITLRITIESLRLQTGLPISPCTYIKVNDVAVLSAAVWSLLQRPRQILLTE